MLRVNLSKNYLDIFLSIFNLYINISQEYLTYSFPHVQAATMSELFVTVYFDFISFKDNENLKTYL